jgi:hypothetical protein
MLFFFPLQGVTLGQDTVPPAEVGGVEIVLGGDDVVVSWDPVTTDVLGSPESISHYNVYRSDWASFVPDRNLHSNIRGRSAGLSFIDQQAALRSPVTEFYLVTAVDPAGNEGPFGPDLPGDPVGTITDPAAGATITGSDLLVVGTVNDRGVEVLVNGTPAVVGLDLGQGGGDPGSGAVLWSVTIPISAGTGSKSITATFIDPLGNSSQDSLSVTRSPDGCTSLPDGTPCSDGIACTQGDRCSSGACVGVAQDVLCNGPDENYDADCDRGRCEPPAGCVAGFETVAESYCCDGSNQTGFCAGGVDAFTCTRDITCDGTGGCGFADDSICPGQDDSDADCTHGGGCVGAGGDADGCGLSGPEFSGSPCEGGFECSTADFCNGAGNCIPGGLDDTVCPNRNDSDADCVRGFCSPTGSCDTQFETSGGSCEGGFECSTADFCNGAGACIAGGLSDALCPNQNNADADCTRGFCQPSGFCGTTNEALGSPCDGGFECSTVDTCSFGTCQPGGLSDALCPNQNNADADCLREFCTGAGACSPANEPLSSPCDDGNSCTSADRCSFGICSGTPIPGCN